LFITPQYPSSHFLCNYYFLKDTKLINFQQGLVYQQQCEKAIIIDTVLIKYYSEKGS